LSSLFIYAALGCSASAQVFTNQYIGTPPLGLRGALPSSEGSEFALTEAVKGGFSYGLGLTSIYDSNFNLSEHDPESELTTNILPWISYASDPGGSAPFSFSASYQPNIRAYVNNPSLNGADHSGGVNLKIQGAKTLIAAYMNYNTVSGTDRYSGTFVNGSLMEAGIRGTYQIAPRTSLFASLKLAMSDYDSSTLAGSDIYTAEVGGFWSATERLSFGPSISYVKEKSANTGERDAWTLNMQARYLMGDKFQFLGTLGLEYATNSRDAGSSTLGLTGRFAANYAISEKLQWESAVSYGTVPSSTDENYVMNNLTFTTALNRQLLRATVSVGLELNISDYEKVGTTGTKLDNEDNLSAFVAYHRKLFSERLDFNSSLRYSMNNGNRDWSQFQVSVGISYQF